MSTVSAAINILAPLLIFAGGQIALFALSWKAKGFVAVSEFLLTALLFSSPLGAAAGHWFSGVLFAITGHTIHL